MASLFDLLQAGQLPSDDSTASAPSDTLTKLLAMLKPDAAGSAPAPGVDVAPMSIAQPSMPTATVPAPLANTPQAAAQPDAPAPPIQAPQAQPSQTATPAAASPSMGAGDILKTILAFAGGLSGEGGISSGLKEYQGLEGQNATRTALLNRGVSPADADAAIKDPQILQAIAPIAFGGTTPEILPPGSSLVGVTKAGKSMDLTPSTVANRAKLQPGQIYNPDGSVGWAPGALQATRDMTAAEGKTYTAADKAAIGVADTKVQNAKQLQADLNSALQYSKTAWQGANANMGSELNYYAPGLAPQGAKDADMMTNVVTNSILPNLKSIFPGRVTNTDVQLIQSLQGIADKPQDVREQILNQALVRSSQLQQQAQAEADELRGQTYYKPGGGDAVTARTDGAAPVTKIIGGVPYHQINGSWYK